MSPIKRSFNLSPDLAQRLDDFTRDNPAVSFTLLVNQAIKQFLAKPHIDLNIPKPMGDDEVDRFLKKNRPLMRKLAK